jgi:hypothetical protein
MTGEWRQKKTKEDKMQHAACIGEHGKSDRHTRNVTER